MSNEETEIYDLLWAQGKGFAVFFCMRSQLWIVAEGLTGENFIVNHADAEIHSTNPFTQGF